MQDEHTDELKVHNLNDDKISIAMASNSQPSFNAV